MMTKHRGVPGLFSTVFVILSVAAVTACVGKRRSFVSEGEGESPSLEDVESDAGDRPQPANSEGGDVPTSSESSLPAATAPVAVCLPGARRCSADGNPQYCDVNGGWQSDAPCPLERASCVDGACVLCSPGSRRCGETGIPEACALDGSAWLAGESCSGDNPFCVPQTGQCGQCSPGDVRPCVEALGNCAAGEQQCTADARWGICSIAPQATDACSPGDDANCDGTPNGGCRCMADVPCGPVGEIGLCRLGVSACVNGVPGACQGAVLPALRDCASPFDNDCDGIRDDTLDANCECRVGDVEECEVHPGQDGQGICRAGTRSCVASVGNLATRWVCQGAVGPRARDCRSALDNDCNGVADNTLDDTCQCAPGTQRSCGAQPGSFGCAEGTQTCEVANGGAQSRWGACRFTPVENGSTCDNGDALTLSESCQNGSCRGLAWGTLAVGSGGFCAIRSGGTVWCWDGAGFSGILDAPERVSLPGPARSVSVGARQACAVLEDGVPLCWGSNDAGQLGTGNLDAVPLSSPARIQDLSSSRMVVAGAEGTTALDGAGSIFVWGAVPNAIFSSLAPGRFTSLVPVQTTTLSSAVMLALGARHACVLLPSGDVSCWGQNEFLQRGSGERSTFVTLSPVIGVNDAVLIDAGHASTCVVRETGNVSCWGVHGSGCAGGPCGTEPTNVPSLIDARQVSVAFGTVCALRVAGSVVCWGQIDLPPTGGGFEDVTQPVAVPNLNDAVLLAATDEVSSDHCALRRSGGIVCWDATLDLNPVTTLPD